MLPSTLWRIGVSPMTVTLGDAPIKIVNAEFRVLVAADLASFVDRLASHPNHHLGMVLHDECLVHAFIPYLDFLSD